MDQFLDGQPKIDQQLRANPSLINDPNYLKGNPQLQVFLTQHPALAGEFKETPVYFMERENRFDAREAAPTQRPNPNPDLTRREIAAMDQFLDGQPQIDQQLRANPSLINDPNYLKAHPQLQVFLTQHPVVAGEFRETPVYFMERENRFDARETASVRLRPDTDLTQKQMADRDRWLDHHRDIDRDLRLNPELANDNDYLDHHKDLRAYLDKNPEVRLQFAPQSAAASTGVTRSNQANRPDFDDRLTTKERQDRDRFLDKHHDVASDLRDNPQLADNKDYLDHHKDLRAFLDKNPGVGNAMRAPTSDQPATAPAKATAKTATTAKANTADKPDKGKADKPDKPTKGTKGKNDKPNTAQHKAPEGPEQKAPVAPQLLH